MDDAVIHHSADQLKQESQLSQWCGIRRRANRNRTSKIAHFFYKIMIVEYEIRILHCRQGRLMEQRQRIIATTYSNSPPPAVCHAQCRSLRPVQCAVRPREVNGTTLQCCDVAL